MSTSSSTRSSSAIQDDLTYYRALLGYLDETSDDYKVRKMELESDIRKLNTQLLDRQREEDARQHEENMKFLDIEGPTQVSAPAQYRRRASQHDLNSMTGFAPYAGSDRNSLGGHFASDGFSAGQGRLAGAPTWDFGTLQSDTNGQIVPSNHFLSPADSSFGLAQSPDAASSASSPGLPPMSSRKRHRETLSLPQVSTGRDPKSMRTTPSPAMTGSTTPSSLDSFDMGDNPDWFRLMGGNPKEHMRELREEQKAQEKALREKQEQERRDEEFARQLMEQYDREAQALPPSSQGSSTTWRGPQGSSQAMLDTNGRLRRPEAFPTVSAFPQPRPGALASSQRSSVKPEVVRPTYPTALKQETPLASRLAPQASLNGMVDLGDGSSDTENDFVDLGSDIEEIDGSNFRDSGRRSKPATGYPWPSMGPSSTSHTNQNKAGKSNSFHAYPELSSTPSAIQYPGSAQPVLPFMQPNMYQGAAGYNGNNMYAATPNPGASSTPNISTWYDAAGKLRHGVAGAANRVYNEAYALIDADISSIPGGISGFGAGYDGFSSAYGATGSSATPGLLGTTPGLDYSGQPQQRSMHSILDDENPYSADDPNSLELRERYRQRYDYLTNDPTRTAGEIKSLLENIRPDEDLPPQNREGTPDAMMYPLMEHQKLGLAWMKAMEEGSNKGGILADDMGLGKTIQALALMVSRRSTDPLRKTTLIVAPVALMKQWEREIEKKLKPGRDHALTTYILHGSKRDASWSDLRRYDVVLTTFGTLANELKRKEQIDMHKRANPNWRPTTKADRLPLLGDECKWYRVIIDEAQCVKNKNTKAAQGAFALQALTRFCMSGTPMMNNVGELFSLIHFLRIKPYNEAQRFSSDFSRPLKGSSQYAKDQAMRKLQALLKAILLRRTKKSMIDGKPILDLPERTTEKQHAVFSEDEEAFYRALETQTQLQFNKYLKAGTVGRHYSNILVLLLRLRQACCHPHLIKDFGITSGVTEVSAKDMIALAEALAPDVVERIKEQGNIECPICMDSADNATIFTPCGHSTCSECFAKISDPAQGIAEGQGADTHEIKCPNCRAKVVPSKVIDYNAFKRVHMPEEFAAENPEAVNLEAEAEAEEETASETDSDDDAEDSDEDDDLDGFVVADNVLDDDQTTSDSDGEPRSRNQKSAPKSKEKKPKKTPKGKAKRKDKAVPRKTLAQLKKEGMRNAKARRKYLRRLEREWETSAKIEKVMDILEATQNRKDNEKTIIFSQFTSMLDLIEVPISRKDWNYKRYDGSMSSNARNDAVLEFTDRKDCRIMLVSLKAGNSGLNLVAASQVIIFDPFWNPYIEEQAIDRAHRIGQMRPVQVHRILVTNTVEDRILALQEKKRELIEGALDENASHAIGRLGVKELAFLFGVPA